MLVQVQRVLDEAGLKSVRQVLDKEAVWQDGKASAGGDARDVKTNLQMETQSAPAGALLNRIATAITSNSIIAAAAMPDQIARLIISRYETGMRYGPHVDAAFMDRVRCDLSFTLFLSDPSEYEGGELVIDDSGVEKRIKQRAGDLTLYSSSYVHRVETVTNGVRLVALGWIKSRVRSVEKRSILFELARSVVELEGDEDRKAARLRISNVRNNLLRSWSD